MAPAESTYPSGSGTIKRVLLGMSGGVDSSAAALLLQQQGYEVTGVTLKLWSEADEPEQADQIVRPGVLGLSGRSSQTCCSLDDVLDARKVADRLGIAHYVFNFKDLFLEQVVQPFVHEYQLGRTPNPCILCNQAIKFDLLMQRAVAMGFDAVATGHYARISRDPLSGEYQLRRGLDPRKDQSYVLYGLSQEQLGRVLLPLGAYRKDEIRSIATEHGLVNAQKPDSQEICFIDDRGYQSFLEQRQAAGEPGDFVDRDGQVIGRHQGIGRYTIGQRKGLGQAFGSRVFVTDIDPLCNQVRLGPEEDLKRTSLVADQIKYTGRQSLTGPGAAPLSITAQIRYQAKPAPAILTPLANNQVRVDFAEPQRAITPGQAVVFYQDDRVLGGGRIVASLKDS